MHVWLCVSISNKVTGFDVCYWLLSNRDMPIIKTIKSQFHGAEAETRRTDCWGGGDLSVKLISVAGPRAWNKSASARAPWADSSRSPLCSGIAHKRATGVRTASAHSLYGYSFISCLHWWGGTRREERLRFDFSAVSPSRSQYGSPETWRESAATRACLTVDGVMTGKPAFPWWQVCLVFVLVCCVSFVLSR